MKILNYYLKGFGFMNCKEYLASTFGFMASGKVVSCSSFLGFISAFLQNHLGFTPTVFFAFVILNLFEFYTGIKASKKKGEKVQSRKMGRMFLKVWTYISIIWMLQSFRKELVVPHVFDIDINPFAILYWAFVFGVIYQLYKSLMENMEALGWKEVTTVLQVTDNRFTNIFESKNK